MYSDNLRVLYRFPIPSWLTGSVCCHPFLNPKPFRFSDRSLTLSCFSSLLSGADWFSWFPAINAGSNDPLVFDYWLSVHDSTSRVDWRAVIWCCRAQAFPPKTDRVFLYNDYICLHHVIKWSCFQTFSTLSIKNFGFGCNPWTGSDDSTVSMDSSAIGLLFKVTAAT